VQAAAGYAVPVGNAHSAWISVGNRCATLTEVPHIHCAEAKQRTRGSSSRSCGECQDITDKQSVYAARILDRPNSPCPEVCVKWKKSRSKRLSGRLPLASSSLPARCHRNFTATTSIYSRSRCKPMMKGKKMPLGRLVEGCRPLAWPAL
jgi:hypothetical protein